MTDLEQRPTLVAKVALCKALCLASLSLAPETLSMNVLLSLEQTYFCRRGKGRGIFCFGLDRPSQATVVLHHPCRSTVAGFVAGDLGPKLHPASALGLIPSPS